MGGVGGRAVIATHPRRGIAASVLITAALAACSGGSTPTRAATGVLDPKAGIKPQPDYIQACTPSGLDSSVTCAGISLAAINAARAREGLKPMALPSNFPRLTIPQQLLVVLDRERVDRGLQPFIGISDRLTAVAQRGADLAETPADPGPPFSKADPNWIGAAANGLDVDYQWLYDDGPGSGVSGCGGSDHSQCWADRHLVLDDFGPGVPVMGAAVNPTASKGDPSIGAVLAAAPSPPSDLTYTWDQAVQATTAGTLKPIAAAPTNESATHIRDPAQNVPASPDFTNVCASTIDSSAPCVNAVLAALNHARGLEGVKPMVLPHDFGQLTVPEQVLVAIDLERVDRNLPPFAGLTADLNRNAQRGADTAADPPDTGSSYDLSDGEWAGGSVNGLDAVYGWMYDDGLGSGNLDCPKKGAEGCWGHRHGILDDFGSVGTLVMGAAVNPVGDKSGGSPGQPSIAATLAVTRTAPGPLVYTFRPVAGG